MLCRLLILSVREDMPKAPAKTTRTMPDQGSISHWLGSKTWIKHFVGPLDYGIEALNASVCTGNSRYRSGPCAQFRGLARRHDFHFEHTGQNQKTGVGLRTQLCKEDASPNRKDPYSINLTDSYEFSSWPLSSVCEPSSYISRSASVMSRTSSQTSRLT